MKEGERVRLTKNVELKYLAVLLGEKVDGFDGEVFVEGSDMADEGYGWGAGDRGSHRYYWSGESGCEKVQLSDSCECWKTEGIPIQTETFLYGVQRGTEALQVGKANFRIIDKLRAHATWAP